MNNEPNNPEILPEPTKFIQRSHVAEGSAGMFADISQFIQTVFNNQSYVNIRNSPENVDSPDIYSASGYQINQRALNQVSLRITLGIPEHLLSHIKIYPTRHSEADMGQDFAQIQFTGIHIPNEILSQLTPYIRIYSIPLEALMQETVKDIAFDPVYIGSYYQ